MSNALDNWNYANDSRTQGPAKSPVLYFAGCGKCGTMNNEADEQACDCSDYEYVEQEMKLPMSWQVCLVCDGEGKHVNPSIDAGGISREQFHDDPDFAEQYWNGDFDQTCTRCNGRTTVPSVNWDALTPKQVELYEAQLSADAEYAAERRAEIMMGC